MSAAVASGIAFAGMAGYVVWRWTSRLRRAEFIRTYTLPKGLFEKLVQRRPQLEGKDCSLVARALRQFFLAYLNSGRRMVSMPSQVADDLWHEFILYTREYERFCRQAFGGFLHHSPAVVMGSQAIADQGLRRVWWQCCKEENINPRKATRLPLLFALDAKLKIADGFNYVVNCDAVRRQGAHGGGTTRATYCGADLSPIGASGCGGSGCSGGGFFGGDGGGSSDGGGCGGGGCGGGGD
jgi:hypothetical protein